MRAPDPSAHPVLWIHTEDLHPLRKHLAAALAPLLAAREQAARSDGWDEALGSCNDYSDPGPNPYRTEAGGPA